VIPVEGPNYAPGVDQRPSEYRRNQTAQDLEENAHAMLLSAIHPIVRTAAPAVASLRDNEVDTVCSAHLRW
jgi:hypothetical protein